MRLIERPILPLMISARGAASWRPFLADAQCDSFIDLWYITLHDKNQMFGYVSNMFGSTFSYVVSPKQNGMHVVTIQVLFTRTTMLNDEDYRYLITSTKKFTR